MDQEIIESLDGTVGRRELTIVMMATAVCFVASLVPWIHHSYDQSDMDAFILVVWLVVPALCAMIANYLVTLRALSSKSPAVEIASLTFVLFLSLVGAVLTAVIVRVVRDCLSDPTSHNLWPFELIIAAFPAGLGAACGALVGGLIAWFKRCLQEASRSN